MLSKATIRYLRSLHDKKFRLQHRAFMVEGPKLVDELLHSPAWEAKHVYATDDWHWPSGIPESRFERISEKELSQVSALATPNKVLAVAAMPEDGRPVNAPERGLHLVLDQVQDPGNLGTILRIADWFGIDSIICSPDCADRFNPKVIQAAMGSVFRMNVYSMPLTDFFIRNATGACLPVYATLLSGDNLFKSQIEQDALIVFGNESRGIHPTILPFIKHALLIPSFARLPEKAESLNVAIAAGIVCAEFRSRGIKK